MSRIKMAVVFLACCTAIGFAQNPSEAPSQPKANPPQIVQVSAADMAGLVDHKVLPRYPEEALAKGIEGDVIFKINVDENGKIAGSAVMQGQPLLVAATRDALRDYTFHPYVLNGTPVRVTSQIGFRFTLKREGDSTEGQVECMSAIP
jgi:TonB family protein